MRVFIADDSYIVVQRLVDILAQIRGLDVIGCAVDALEAKQSIERLSPEVVILDLQFPKGRGVDVLKAIKRTRPNTTVMVLTNFSYPPYRKRCLEAGADFFLDKSADFQRIPEIFEKLLEDSLVGSSP